MKTVLIVEDEYYMAMILKVILIKNYECEVKIATGVKEGIEMLELFTPDLIITDIHLSDGTAFEMLPELSISRKKGAKLILMSAGDNSTERQKIPSTAIDLFIEKPFTREKIFQSLKELDFV
jgi:response regulator of citrate/malate metabolism